MSSSNNNTIYKKTSFLAGNNSEFIKEFYQVTGIKTDPIYSGKLFYSLIDQLRTNNIFKNKTIIVLHSGGISGIKGFEERYNIKIFN